MGASGIFNGSVSSICFPGFVGCTRKLYIPGNITDTHLKMISLFERKNHLPSPKPSFLGSMLVFRGVSYNQIEPF